jgi:hypothetical protein
MAVSKKKKKEKKIGSIYSNTNPRLVTTNPPKSQVKLLCRDVDHRENVSQLTLEITLRQSVRNAEPSALLGRGAVVSIVGRKITFFTESTWVVSLFGCVELTE